MVEAKELVNIAAQLPRSAIEAHGLGMKLKIYEIANSVADAVMDLTVTHRSLGCSLDNRPSHILSRLHSILLNFRGGGKKELVDTLYRKMIEVQMKLDLVSAPLRTPTLQSPREVRDANRQPVHQMNKEMQSGFDLTEATTTNSMPATAEYVLTYPESSNQFVVDDSTFMPSDVGIGEGLDDQSAGQSQYDHLESSSVPYLLDAFFPSLASGYNTFNELASDTTLFPAQAQIHPTDAADEPAISQIPQPFSFGVGTVGELVGDDEMI
ncbi:hypothetical protein Plec18167_002683 [Paecilomyces lecythidis]|uniref:Uncharacterized protein n=1 Tax=Paecilomyces lecythidis TaxID=3004212 RepID=A0ABR3Y6W0_9EURO